MIMVVVGAGKVVVAVMSHALLVAHAARIMPMVGGGGGPGGSVAHATHNGGRWD